MGNRNCGYGGNETELPNKLERNLKKSAERLTKQSKDPKFIEKITKEISTAVSQEKLSPVEALERYFKNSAEQQITTLENEEYKKQVIAAKQNDIADGTNTTSVVKADWAIKEHDAMIESLSQLFDSHDVDKNGTLSLVENRELMKEYISHKTAYAKKIFVSCCEALMDHHIQLQWAHLSKRGFPVKHNEFVRMFKAIAKYLVMLNIEDPYKGVEKDLLLRIDEINVAIFKQMDKNHDSQVSKEEFIEHFGLATKKFAEPSANQYAVIHQLLNGSMGLVMGQLIALVQQGAMTGKVVEDIYDAAAAAEAADSL